MIFRQNPNVAPLSWLSLLFAILALACRAEENSQSCLFDKLSKKYEKAAWDCLSINKPPFESSTTALNALILIIYGRIHRGEDVSRNLQTAYNMATSISCHQCPAQPVACEEHRNLWISLKMLFSMNSQVYGDCRDQEGSWSLRLLAGIDCKEPVEVNDLPMRMEPSPPLEMTFTMLQFHVLEMSDTVALSTQHGLLSEWSLPELSVSCLTWRNIAKSFTLGPVLPIRNWNPGGPALIFCNTVSSISSSLFACHTSKSTLMEILHPISSQMQSSALSVREPHWKFSVPWLVTSTSRISLGIFEDLENIMLPCHSGRLPEEEDSSNDLAREDRVRIISRWPTLYFLFAWSWIGNKFYESKINTHWIRDCGWHKE